MNRRKKYLVIVMGFIIIAVLFIVMRALNLYELTPKFYSGFQLLSIKEHYPEAQKVANEWRDDNYLRSVNLYIKPLGTSESLWVDYFFRSENEPLTLNVLIEVTPEGYTIESREGDYSAYGEPPEGFPFNLDDIPFDSIEAFEKMIENVDSHPNFNYTDPNEISPIWMWLCRREKIDSGREPYWELFFGSEFPDGIAWYVKMNAITNEVFPPYVSSKQ